MLAAILLVLVAGCGGDESASSSEAPADNKTAIKETVTGYYAALAGQDAEAACEFLSPSGQGEVVKFAASTDRSLTGAGCAEGVKAFYFGAEDVDFVEVSQDALSGTLIINNETASLKAENRLPFRLEKEGDRWLIASLGLEPQVALGELTPSQEVQLARANLGIAKFCVDAIGYLNGIRDSVPSDARFAAKSAGVDTLVRLARDAPEATTSKGDSMRDVLLSAASDLENGGCDEDSARRLARTANGLP